MSWITTFYYGQELRSTYMNNIVSGLIKPGIYAADAAVYTVSNEGESDLAAGVYLLLKKDTTLVFSNGYTVTDSLYARDLNSLGDYVIKCVLDTDTSFLLASPVAGSYTAYITTGATAPIAFVTAQLSYDADSAGGTAPTISLKIPSSNTDDNFDSSTWTLPNEDQTGKAGDDTSYLILGVLLDTFKNSTAYATAGTGWTSNGESNWIKNHVFTGRGLPEYMGGMFKTSTTPLSSIAFGAQFNRMFLTEGQYYYNSTLYRQSGPDWKSLFGQGGAVYGNDPQSTGGCVTDATYDSDSATTYTKSPLTLSSSLADKWVVEFLFMALSAEYADSDVDASLTGLFSDNTVTKKLLPYRVICDASSEDLDASQIHADDDFFSISGRSCCPLDLGISNIERLKLLVANKNVFLPVVDAMRRDSDLTPFLDATVGDSLLPISISFRQVNSTGTDYTDPASSNTTFSSSISAVSPANVLSLFELQSTSYAVTAAAFIAAETFTTLPFLQ
jgi:hypothetical protein